MSESGRPCVLRWTLRFARDRRGSSAVEFAIIAMPFFMLLIAVTQVGIFYMAQSALDTGVIKTAEMLRNNFTTGTTAVLPSASTLKSKVSEVSGIMVPNSGNLAVELLQFVNLSSAAVPITDGTADYGTTTSTLVLRAQATVVTLMPGLGNLNIIRSSAIVRRRDT